MNGQGQLDMKDPRKIIFLMIGVVAALVILRFTLFAPSPNDQVLISQALMDSIQASKEGRPGGVLDLLSSKFKINDQEPGRFDIAKFIRERKPDVTVDNDKAVVSGDSAQIQTSVEVKLSFLNQNFDQRVDNVTLVFQKEAAHKYLVIPTTAWHLTDVEVPNNSIPLNLPTDGLGF
jgi:hypothetical protein